jgi:hypothetical protein
MYRVEVKCHAFLTSPLGGEFSVTFQTFCLWYVMDRRQLQYGAKIKFLAPSWN